MFSTGILSGVRAVNVNYSLQKHNSSFTFNNGYA